MKADIRDYIKSCEACQMVKPTPHPTYGPLMLMPSPAQPFQLLAIDAIHMGASTAGTANKYIQVVVNHHSRYVWANATKKNTANAINSFIKYI